MTDKWTIHAVIIALSAFAIIGLCGMIWLVDHGRPAALVAIISTPTGVALGALGAVLVSTRSTESPPQEVQVMNEPNEAVPVTPADSAPVAP